MTTTGERLVTLSELPGVETALVHFAAIDTSGGPGGTVLVDMGDLIFEAEPDLVLEPDPALVLATEDDMEIEGDGDMVLTPDDDVEVGCE